MRHCSIHNTDYFAQCDTCGVDADEREIRKQGLIATAGLIAADRRDREIAALASQLPIALDELERIANTTRRGVELAVYKTALDDVRAVIARGGRIE